MEVEPPDPSQVGDLASPNLNPNQEDPKKYEGNSLPTSFTQETLGNSSQTQIHASREPNSDSANHSHTQISTQQQSKSPSSDGVIPPSLATPNPLTSSLPIASTLFSPPSSNPPNPDMTSQHLAYKSLNQPTPPASLSVTPNSVDRKPAPATSPLPWASRFKSSLHNLKNTYASPTYTEDGIPIVEAPVSVLLKASEEWPDFIVAHFCGKPPPPEKIYSDLNPIWGKQGNIFLKRRSADSYLIFIPSIPTREWVLEVGYWQSDSCGFKVTKWSASGSLKRPKITSMPIWAQLKNILMDLYTLEGIGIIASAMGKPLHTEKSKLNRIHIGEVKVKVEFQLNIPLPDQIIVRDKYGDKVLINVSYPRLPPKCSNCDEYGHLKHRCFAPINQKDSVLTAASPDCTDNILPTNLPTQTTIGDVPPVPSATSKLPPKPQDIQEKPGPLSSPTPTQPLPPVTNLPIKPLQESFEGAPETQLEAKVQNRKESERETESMEVGTHVIEVVTEAESDIPIHDSINSLSSEESSTQEHEIIETAQEILRKRSTASSSRTLLSKVSKQPSRFKKKKKNYILLAYSGGLLKVPPIDPYSTSN